MQKLGKKIISLLLCMTMLASVGVTASAADLEGTVDIITGNSQTITQDMLKQNYPEIAVPDKLLLASENISEDSVDNDVAVMAENQPPVAELRTSILNPESMVNGKFTTETQIAWLWSYNGQNFTYDPDGDAITDIKIGGIANADILGTLQGNIGFVTQCKTAGQYQLSFQVQDARGALSNIAKYGFTIEPSDGNTRPICRVGHSSNTLTPNQLMLFSWSNSYDNDPGDKLTSVSCYLLKDGVLINPDGYIKSNDNESMLFSSPTTGTYEIWVRVCDSHNAWSDWAIIPVTVEELSVSNITVEGAIAPYAPENYWVDNFKAKEVDDGQISEEGVMVLCRDFGSHEYPSDLPQKVILSNTFSVSGRLTTKSGAPLANASVDIDMPLNRTTNDRIGFHATVNTDANGNFTYAPHGRNYWTELGFYRNPSDVDTAWAGDTSGKHTRYIHFSTALGTNFFYPTTLTVSVNGSTVHSEDVACEIGYSRNPMIGNSIRLNGHWGGF